MPISSFFGQKLTPGGWVSPRTRILQMPTPGPLSKAAGLQDATARPLQQLPHGRLTSLASIRAKVLASTAPSPALAKSGGAQDATGPGRMGSARASVLKTASTKPTRTRSIVEFVTLADGRKGWRIVGADNFPVGYKLNNQVFLPGHAAGSDMYQFWQWVMAKLRPVAGFTYYSEGGTGNDYHVRHGQILGYRDLTTLMQAMDGAGADWKHVEKIGYRALSRMQKYQRWIRIMLNRANAVSNVMASIPLADASVVPAMKTTVQVQTLGLLGWEQVNLDPLAMAGLCVHATLDPTVTPAALPQHYSGRKTSLERADMQAYRNRIPGETNGSSRYALDSNGDSVVINKHYRGEDLVKTDTVRAR